MTKSDLDGAVKFESNKKLHDTLKDPETLMSLVTDVETIVQVETIVRSWMKKMEWVNN